PQGPFAVPGTYQVSLSQRVLGEWQDLAGPQPVVVKPMFEGGLVTDDREALHAFQMQTASLYRAVEGAERASGEIQARIDHLMAAIRETPGASEADAQAVRGLRTRMQDVVVALSGDSTVSSRNEATPMSIATRISNIVNGSWDTQSGPSGNLVDSYAIADRQFRAVIAELKSVDSELQALEAKLETEGAPWTPGRVPDWD
ncbi:MAG: hypothetical protein R3212_07535, partial [Xanthomonadales bacterium]|nr:hypothetical protein [Xanthomonadales bacterium]